MQKTLRSLIHEKIPLELRFQLELLSRKRNLINDEKFEKIIELNLEESNDFEIIIDASELDEGYFNEAFVSASFNDNNFGNNSHYNIFKSSDFTS